MFFVYALYSKKYNKIYIGQTEDLEESLKLHKSKTFRRSYTSRFDGKWILIYKEAVVDRKQALAIEKQLKSFKGREFIKQYIPL